MFRFVALASLILGAAAFAPVPAKIARVSKSLNMAFEAAEGAQPPLGFWDPLGFLKDADQTYFDQLRYIELKHGRICMLAVVGYLVQWNNRFPGVIDLEGHKFSDYPSGELAIRAIPTFGLLQIIFSIGYWELKVWKQVEGSTPGDFGIPYLGQFKTDAQKAEIRAKELNNGRAAQMGLLALLVHEKIDGHPFVINDLLGL